MSSESGLRSALAAPLRTPRDVAVVVLAGTVATLVLEALLFVGAVRAAAAGYAVTYAGLALLAVRLHRCIVVVQAFAFLAVFRLVNLAVPAFTDLSLYWLPLVYLPFVPAVVLAVRSRPASGASNGDFSDSPALPPASSRTGSMAPPDSSPPLHVLSMLLPTFLLLGAGLAVAERLVRAPTQLVPQATVQASLLLALVVIVVAAVEELLFRGLLQSALTDWFGAPTAVGLASLVFAAMQLDSAPGAVATAFLAGLVYGTAYEFTDRLAAPVLVHAFANVVLFVVLPVHGDAVFS